MSLSNEIGSDLEVGKGRALHLGNVILMGVDQSPKGASGQHEASKEARRQKEANDTKIDFDRSIDRIRLNRSISIQIHTSLLRMST